MRYFPIEFSEENTKLLSIVKEVLGSLKDMLPLTLRQIFYQVISLQDSPLENSRGDYGKLSRLLVKARFFGEISFDNLEDRTRYTSNSPVSLENLIYYYYPEAWNYQPCYVEVFVEKEGLRSFFVRTLEPLYVSVTPIRGFDSLSDVMEAAKRLYKHRDRQRFILIFSDFDPSGECISKDFEFRLKKCLVMLGEEPGSYDEENKIIELQNITAEKIALTLEQVEKYKLPPKFVKPQDPRASTFTKKYGTNSVVELDALPPDTLQSIILENIRPYLDSAELERIQKIEHRIKTEGLEI